MMAMFVLSACSSVMGYVESEDGLPDDQANFLVTIGMIDKGENIRFYTSGSLSYRRAGYLFTDVRVGTYWLPDSAPEENRVEWILLKEVKSIEFTDTDDSWARYAYLTVTPETGKSIRVNVPGSDGYRKRFHEALMEQWKKVKPRPASPSPGASTRSRR